MCCYCCFCCVAAHTRGHDVHTMTADCWLPKAPRPWQSTNESSGAPGSEVSREELGRRRTHRAGRDSLMTALIFGFTN